MAEVLYVSKPVVPPWNDSSKNLVRELAAHLRRYEPHVLGRRSPNGWRPPRGTVEAVYPSAAGGFAPALRDNAHVLARLMTGPPCDLWHFFFAPNPRSSKAGRAAARLRRVPTVQTVCSAPPYGADLRALLFADRTVVLSRHTERRLQGEGVPAHRLHRIPPAIEPLGVPGEDDRRRVRDELGLPQAGPLLVFPGDLEFGLGADRTIEALAMHDLRDAHLVMACRAKTERARHAEATLRERARELGLGERVTWLGETARIHALLGAADVVLLPSDDLFAKMDHPLVLLEAMSMQRPVVVARATAAEELTENGAALAVAPEPEAVAHAVRRLLDDDAQRVEMGELARAAVVERYAPARMADAYEALYDDVLGRRTPPV
ncbi:MAG: glycosyltransferase family 4 protein [Myxococcota bacterium]